ncbi:hypothetical protein HZH68_005702 [Vespula germanica]|uniref:WW domain-containing protein n=1 Tax=Vespula germanica TaxID=30212 RepID=A0A834KGM7_VESGE|nr:hypothetical protein HZH68_005702 [Vespula germanica]
MQHPIFVKSRRTTSVYRVVRYKNVNFICVEEFHYQRSDWSLDVNESKNNDNNWSTFNLASDNQLKRAKHNKVDNPSRSTFFDNNVRSFGDYVEKHDWVECKSKSIPGKTYYFNLRSGCSTWYRPISRYIDIPYYPERVSLNKVQCYLSSPSLMVSDSYNDDCNFDEVSSSIKLKKENEKKKNLSNSPRSNDVFYYHDDDRMTIKKKVNYNDSNLNNDSTTNDSSSFIDVTNFLQCQLSENNDLEDTSVELKSMKKQFVENKHSNDDRVNELSENNINKKYDTSSRRIKKKRDRTETTKIVSNDSKDNKMLMRKPERIICNMYGVTTVNYDEVSELPPNVKRSNLSDSTSIVSSSTTEENRSRSSILECFLGHDDLYDNILPPKLSDSNSSTSSSSRTCDTRSSCSCTQSDSTQG